MPDPALTGSEFKKQLRAGQPKMGLFLNAHSPTVAEQLAHSGYDWLLVDSQHGPMGYEKLSAMLSGIANGGAGCCNETQARMRSGGKERLLFSWYQGQAYVLSYYPVFGFFVPSTRLWEAGSGLSHPVRYGLDDIDSITMISAIYGVTPAYEPDSGAPLPRPVPSPTETLDQAETFAEQPNVSPKSVAALLIAARDNGIVDERSLDVAASLIGHDQEGWAAVTDFVKKLTNAQTELLVEKVLKRLETPNICEHCVASRSVDQRGYI